MFLLQPTEYIQANCGTNNAINLSIIGQGDISTLSETSISNLVQPLSTVLTTLFTASQPTNITHFIFTNVTNSTVTGVNLYLNGVKIVSDIIIKGGTTVTLDSGGFSQYPKDVPIINTGGGTNYTFTQGVPATTWVISHTLGYYPNVTVVDSGGTEVIGNKTYNDISTITLTFSAAFSGVAYLS